MIRWNLFLLASIVREKDVESVDINKTDLISYLGLTRLGNEEKKNSNNNTIGLHYTVAAHSTIIYRQSAVLWSPSCSLTRSVAINPSIVGNIISIDNYHDFMSNYEPIDMKNK